MCAIFVCSAMRDGVDGIRWEDGLSPQGWDAALAELGGHPLQSALWGDARRVADGIADRRWAAMNGDAPVHLLRVERRPLRGFGAVGWAPRALDRARAIQLPPADRLRHAGIALLIRDRWAEANEVALPAPKPPHTIWIDLAVGREALWRNLDKQWRYGVGRAERSGVTVAPSRAAEDVAAFHSLCLKVSTMKGFALRTSPALMNQLLARGEDEAVEAALFCARQEGRIGAGAFIIRCGRSVHYFWGAADRAMSRACVGEAVQWGVILWALAKGCTRYDLEGVTPDSMTGTDAFKMKMGGRIVTLAGKMHHPLSLKGRLLARLDTLRRA